MTMSGEFCRRGPIVLDLLDLLPSYEQALTARPADLCGHSIKRLIERSASEADPAEGYLTRIADDPKGNQMFPVFNNHAGLFPAPLHRLGSNTFQPSKSSTGPRPSHLQPSSHIQSRRRPNISVSMRRLSSGERASVNSLMNCERPDSTIGYAFS